MERFVFWFLNTFSLYALFFTSYTNRLSNQNSSSPLIDRILSRNLPSQEWRVTSRLDGVMVSVLATERKGRKFKPCQGDGFLRAIQIRCTAFFQ
jgi:hypothetical protein